MFLAFLLGCSGGPKTVDEFLAAAKNSYEQGNYFEARKYLAQAIKLKPTDKEVIYQMGRNYAAENMYDSAFAHLSRADKLYPNDRRINELLHDMCVETEHWQEAIQALFALSRTGDPPEMHYKEIAEHAKQGKIGNMAEFYFGKLVEQYPDSMMYYVSQAEGAYWMEEPDKSAEIITEAIKRLGDRPLLLSELGKYYGLNGNLDEAEKTLRILVAKDSTIINQLQLATTLAFQKSRSKKEEAYALFKKLRDKSPDMSRVDSILSSLEKELTKRP